MKRILNIKFYIITFIFFLTKNSISQDNTLVQFSGIIVASDSLTPVSFANIIIKGTHRGTISDYYGFFSFVAQTGDTIQFSSIGYKKAYFVIPDTLKEHRYSLIQVMIKDTVQLPEALIYPWPSKEQFKEAFLNLRLPKDDYQRAYANLSREELMKRYEITPMDASMNYKFAMQQQYSRIYSIGQLPYNNLLNPLAWMEFIKAWKRGDFKRKK